jgi:hypothetical protein
MTQPDSKGARDANTEMNGTRTVLILAHSENEAAPHHSETHSERQYTHSNSLRGARRDQMPSTLT